MLLVTVYPTDLEFEALSNKRLMQRQEHKKDVSIVTSGANNNALMARALYII